MKNGIVLLSLFLLFCAKLNAQAVAVVPFLPPDQIKDEKERSTFFAEHYWERFDFSDTTILKNREFKERAIPHYLMSISFADVPTIQKSIHNTLSRAEVCDTMYKYFLDRLEFYTGDALSYLRNEDWAEAVLEHRISSKYRTYADSIQMLFHLKRIRMNRPGTQGPDLEYVDIKRNKGNLYNIEAENLMLYLFIPGCPQCFETRRIIEEDSVYRELIESGNLKVLAFYPETDTVIWDKYEHSIPKYWINAYDPYGQISDKNLYMMSAAPTIYMLDKNKKIVLKDPQLGDLFLYFKKISMDANKKKEERHPSQPLSK